MVLCPICNRFKALKMRKQVSQLMEIVCEEHDSFAFVTLTQPNVPVADMPAAFERQDKALRRFYEGPVRRSFIGHVTAIEIAIRDDGQSAGVHSHSIVVLHPDYYSRAHDYYLDNWTLSDLWGHALRADKPVVDIRKVRTDGSQIPRTALAELLKYCIKPNFDQETETGFIASPEVCAMVVKTLYKRRTLRFGGVVADAQRIFRQRAKNRSQEVSDV